MTEANVWDDPDLKAGGDFVSFDVVGDSVSGTIDVIRKHTFDDGKVVPQILLTCDDGEERTLTAGQIRLKLALTEARPVPGDHLAITLTQIEKRSGGKTLKHFDVKVTPRGSTVAAQAAPAPAPAPVVAYTATAPAPAPAVPDPAAAAAALAALSPEQRAALGLPPA